MTSLIILSGDYSYSSYKASGLAADTIIDATNASWIVANQGSPTSLYPFGVTGAGANLVVLGGTINGTVSQTGDWESIYINSAAVRVNSAYSFVIDGWTITKPWDGIRVGGTGTFLIEDCYVGYSRDDAVEDDDVIGGTIRDSLFDNVFSGVSLGDGDVDGSDNTVTMEGMLLGMKEYLYKGDMAHGSPFKLDKGTGSEDVVPSLRFIDCVVAITDVDHNGMERLQRAWDKTVESHGNYYLNLSDTPLPPDYPMPPAGWTVLQGQAARDYWANAKAVWHADHDEADTLTGSLGADSMAGGLGNDTYYVNNVGDSITEGANGGYDRVLTSISYILTAGAQVELFTTTNPGGAGAINLTGNAFAQRIVGNAGANIIIGGGGADSLNGGGGNDRIYVDHIGDKIIEGADGGYDRVLTSVSYVLTAGAQVELFTTTNAAGTGSINLTGNAFSQRIVGNAGANVINGGGGADLMQGLGGNDIYYVDNAGDSINEGAAGGYDRVLTSISYALTAGVEIELFTTTNAAGTAAINLTGNASSQRIVGNAGANTIKGGSGNDTVSGCAGSDRLYGEDGNDTLIGGVGADYLSGGTGTDTVSYADAAAGLIVSFTKPAANNGEAAGDTYSSIESLIGSKFNDALVGNSARNGINGGAGNDKINGCLGNDTLTGGAGNDIFVFNTAPSGGTNFDRITDFSVFDDTIRLDDAIFAALGAPGVLAAGAFRIGAAAADASDRIVYNSVTGGLDYDADGTGGTAAIRFATLDAGLALTSADFFVI